MGQTQGKSSHEMAAYIPLWLRTDHWHGHVAFSLPFHSQQRDSEPLTHTTTTTTNQHCRKFPRNVPTARPLNAGWRPFQCCQAWPATLERLLRAASTRFNSRKWRQFVSSSFSSGALWQVFQPRFPHTINLLQHVTINNFVTHVVGCWNGLWRVVTAMGKSATTTRPSTTTITTTAVRMKKTQETSTCLLGHRLVVF
jgi:hypothetical protein